MDNPGKATIIVNIKGVSQEQWERAKTAANRADETLGEWVSRACKLLADAEEGGREFPPGVPLVPRRAMTPEQLAGLMNAAAALSAAQAKPVPSRTASALPDPARQIAPMGHDKGRGERPATKIR